MIGNEVIDKTQTPKLTNNKIEKTVTSCPLTNFSPVTAPSVKAEAIGKIEQSSHPTHDNAIVKKMKIFKTCILNDDQKGVSEILQKTEDLKNLENL